MTENPRFKTLLATAAVLTVLLPINAPASGRDKAKNTPWYQQETVQQELELTTDQVAEIGKIEESFGPRLVSMNQEKRAAHRTMITALDNSEISEDQFRAKRERLETAYGSHAALTADRWQALRNVLTEEQWRRLPEVAPKILLLGHFGVAKRGGFYMGPGRPTGASKKTGGN